MKPLLQEAVVPFPSSAAFDSLTPVLDDDDDIEEKARPAQPPTKRKSSTVEGNDSTISKLVKTVDSYLSARKYTAIESRTRQQGELLNQLESVTNMLISLKRDPFENEEDITFFEARKAKIKQRILNLDI
jgi:hypothetical protein